jgi:hypothetical protein
LNTIGYLIGLFCLFTLLYAICLTFGRTLIKNRRTPLHPYLSDAYPEFNRENQIKGYEFERYVVSKLDRNYFTCIYWRGDKLVGNIFPVSNSYPDLEFDYKDSVNEISFAIECKWRKSYFENGISWARHSQIEQYKNYERESKRKVFVVIGIGGTPGDAGDLFVIPLSDIPRHLDHLSAEFLQPYKKRSIQNNFFLNKNSMRLA